MNPDPKPNRLPYHILIGMPEEETMPNNCSPFPQPIFLTERQVADMICQSVRTIQKWRVTGHGPAFHKFGQSVRYSLADVHDWIAHRRVLHTAQLGLK